MSENTKKASTSTDESGFARVLDAEKDADARIAAGRAEAEHIRQDALGRDRRIAARTDQRVQALHGGMKSSVEDRKASMATAFEAEKAELATPPSQAEIKAAASRLARRLIGIDPA